MIQKKYIVKSENQGQRLDVFLTDKTGLTRAEVQKWIKNDNAKLVSGKVIRQNYHVSEAEEIQFSWEEREEIELVAENIPLHILYEDEDMMVINKERGMVVHPGAGNTSGTLANALLFHCGDSILTVGDRKRPGIVHRLDKDTSGVMVVPNQRLRTGSSPT